MTRFYLLPLLLTAALGLAACTDTLAGIKQDMAAFKMPSFKSAEVPDETCPEMRIVPDLSSYYEFSGLSTSLEDDASMNAQLRSFTSECVTENGRVAATAYLDFAIERSAKDTSEASYAIPYFFAVTDSSGQIISKQLHTLDVVFTADDSSTKRQMEMVTQSLPALEGYAVLIGFQLSSAQLEYNRLQLNTMQSSVDSLVTPVQ